MSYFRLTEVGFLFIPYYAKWERGMAATKPVSLMFKPAFWQGVKLVIP